jgi:hypothetical protein
MYDRDYSTAAAMEGAKNSERTREKRAEPKFETPPDAELYCTL